MKTKLLNNIGLKIIALVFAVILWALVMNLADPITTKSYSGISVSMLNEEIVTDKGKVYRVVSGEPTVTVLVTAKTSVLSTITASNIEATADFKELELSSLLPVRVNIAGYEGQYQATTVTPTNLEVSIEDSESKKFPITAVTVGAVADGHVLGSLVATPETLSVSGAQSVVERINKVVAQVNVSELSEDAELEAELVLYDIYDAVVDQTLLSIKLESDLMVTVDVLDTKMVPITLETSGEPEEGYGLSTISSEPTEIMITGKRQTLESTNAITIPGTELDITGKSGKVEQVVDITSYLPEGIELVDENANLVAVTIQINLLGTISFEIPVESIEVFNNPSNLKLKYNNTDDLMLTFTGLEAALAAIGGDEIRASIDLKEYTTPGDYVVPVTISPIADCELVESVTVPISLEALES